MSVTTVRIDTAERHTAKYANRNILHRLSLGRFHDVVARELRTLAPASILDFGCGEGYAVDELQARNVELKGYEGVDVRPAALASARARLPGRQFHCADIHDQKFDGRRFDLVMALEVFEHLFEPEPVLRRLCGMTDKALLLTVPHEPWFQLVNLARGRDFIRLGNHPEHVQHWNQKTFAAFLSPHVEIVRIQRSFPFLIATARPRR